MALFRSARFSGRKRRWRISCGKISRRRWSQRFLEYFVVQKCLFFHTWGILVQNVLGFLQMELHLWTVFIIYCWCQTSSLCKTEQFLILNVFWRLGCFVTDMARSHKLVCVMTWFQCRSTRSKLLIKFHYFQWRSFFLRSKTLIKIVVNDPNFLQSILNFVTDHVYKGIVLFMAAGEEFNEQNE